ncbi:MAG: xylulokinase [Planctomycetota bacterium]
MGEPALFLGFDVGTQSTKAVLVDAQSHAVVARAQQGYGLLPDLPAGCAEQHPDTWIGAVATAARMALQGVDPRQVAGIGVSGQQHGAVVLDARDQVIRPAKLWCDTSTAREAQELGQKLGRAVPTGFTASKLLWLRRHEPANWARVRSVLLPHDYVNLRLCGERSMECGDASGTGLFDPAARTFDANAIAAVDPALATMLPQLLPAGAVAGHLSADGARLLGLPTGVPLATGGGDNMMAAIGSGATRAGTAVLSLGTSGTVFARSDAPVVDPDGLIAPFCSSDGAWLPLLCVMNVTGVTEAVRGLGARSHGELTELARAVPPGCDGLLWLPFLQGERVPDLPHAAGTLLGMRPGSLQPGPLYRAALEGTACNLALGTARLRALGIPVERAALVGGAANNALWRQILADTLGVPVVPLEEPEAAALGAAIQAIWTVRRHAGEDVDCEAVARPFVREAGAPVAPGPHAAFYQGLVARFAEAVRHVYGTG